MKVNARITSPRACLLIFFALTLALAAAASLIFGMPEVASGQTALVTTSVSEITISEGHSAEYQVKLGSQPPGNVIVMQAVLSKSQDRDDVAISPQFLNFDRSNWDTYQTVAVSAYQDDDSIDDSAVIGHEALNDSYQSYGEVTEVSVTVSDDDPAPAPTPTPTATPTPEPSLPPAGLIIVTPPDSALDDIEGIRVPKGGQASFTVRLATQPTDDVPLDITLVYNRRGSLTSSPSSMMFTTADWDRPQTVTVRSAAWGNNSNAVLRLNTGYTEDDAYYFLGWIDYRVREYDAPGIVLSPSQVAVGEGSTTTYGVRLNTKPTADVTVAVAEGTGDSDITVTSSKTLDFTAYNWKRSQYVTLSAAHDDDLVNGSRAIMHTASGGDYAGIAATLTATEADDETAALLLSTNAVTVPEGGSASYTVRLSAQPASAVSVSIAADTSQDGDFVPAPASLSFNASNWNSAQTVSIAAREDDDGVNGSADIRHTASGAEFNGLTATVLASESDNDTPGITFSPPLGPIFIPEGGSYLYTVVLDTAPTAEVSITVSISGDDDINIPGTSKTWSFNAADWNTPKQIRIRADEDGDTDNGTATVSHTITTADSDYAEMSIGDITATERDNDLSVTLSTNALTVPEGSTASYTVKLSVQPTDDVTVVISEGTGGGNDADITVSSPASKTLTFTASSYNTAQTVTLRAAPDSDPDDGSRTFTHTANGGGYTDVTAALTATENDNTPVLTASGATATTVTLSIDNYSGNWRYKHTGQGATCSSAVSGTIANVTGLSVNTQYTFKAYNDDCAVAMVTASAFTTANPSLASSNISNDSATLTLSAWTPGKDGNWHYKHNGQGATCSSAVSGTTASLAGLDSGTQYTYTAYGDSGCTTAISAAHTFTTSAYSLTASNPTATTATLTIANYSSNWHYKYTSPTGGTCSAAQTGTTVNLTGLTKNTTYTYTAYSDSSCSTELAAASAFTTTNPTLASSSVTHNSATLTLSGWTAGTGTGKDGNWHLNQVGHGTSSCTGPFSAATVNLTGLDAGSQYNYQAYSDNGCSAAISAAHSFTTPATPTLTAGTPTATTVTLTIGNYSSNWHHKYTSPTGGICSAAVSGTTANLTGLTKNTSYTFKAYRDSSCSDELATASAFTTTNPTLASSDITHNSATLALSGWAAGTGTGKDGNWYFKADKAPHSSCSTAQSGASVSLSGFNAGTQYTYTAYSDSGCATAISAAHSLTTTASTLTAGTPTATTVTLTVTNHTGNWHYKYTSPTGGTCSTAVTGTAANLTGLTRNTTYTFKAYSDSNCATEIATASNFTTTNPTLTASSVTHNSATLTLSGWTVGTGTGKDGNWYYKEEAGSSLQPIPCSSMQTGTSANITSGLQAGRQYAFSAYSDSACATTITPELSFVTPALTPGTTPTATTNTLTISDYTGNWYHKHAGQGATCSSAVTGTTANLTGLTKNTSYTYTAYNDSACSSVVAIAAAFTTATPTLASSNIAHVSATLTVSGWAAGTGSGKDGNWHYKYTSPTGGTCSAAQSGQSASVTNLLGSTTYTFKAYSDSSCATEIATAANFTTLPPVLTASGITGTAATLKLQGSSAAWYYKRVAGTPADTTCNTVAAGTSTASLSGLTANTLYGYTAYSDSTCSTAIDTHHFATTAYDVGNLDVAAYDECYVGVISNNARRCAVAFTTGSRTDGYALQSVTAKFKDKQGSPGSIVVAIHAADSNNSSNSASTAKATLTGSDPDTAGLQTYACSGGAECTLAASTTYFVVMSTADTTGTAQGYKWETTASNDETNHPSTGVWAISNQGRHKRGSNAWTDLSFSRTGMLHIAANDAPVSISASGITTAAATLTIDGHTSAWYYKRTGGPSDTTCNSVAAGTSTASLSSLNAGTSYTYTAYTASDCGSGTLDATTFSTLMPVDNLDKTAHQDPCKVSGNSRCALAFTTGTAAGGYTLESLTAKFNAKVDNVAPYQDPGSIIVTLHADNSGVPADTALATLSGSDPDTAGDYTYACSGSGCALSPSTTYFAQFTAASGRAADEYYAWVTTASDDQNLSPTGNGWSLANNTDYYYFHNWGTEHDRAGLLKITAAVKPGLTASSVAETSATLTLSHYSGAWWYRGSQSSATCESVAAGTSTASLSALSSNSGNEYTYKAYGASGCDSADELASVTFITPTLTAGTPSGTSVTLTIDNHAGNWYYKHTSPFSGTCSSAQTGTFATFSTLLGGATYTFKAYSDSACSTALATAASFTTSGISVNNLGETIYGSPPWNLPDGSGLVTKLANSFETGSNSAGYTLNNVLVKFGATTGSPGNLTVSIYSHNSGSGNPNASVITLSGSNPTTAGDYKYTCSSSCDLSKDTTYWLVLGATNSNTSANKYIPKWTGSKSQTTAPSAASAWSIGDGHKIDYSGIWYAGSSASAAYLMFGITATAK